MTILSTKTYRFLVIGLLLITFSGYSQNGSLTINQDKEIDQLLAIKKDMNTSENESDRYKIQIYSGDRVAAERAKSTFSGAFSISSKLVYETPNYKVWVGNFRSRLEADRALLKIQNKFPNAFRFKPKKDKEH